MKKLVVLAVLMCLVVTSNQQAETKSSNAKTKRVVAITFDDLPVVSLRRDIEARKEITSKLLSHIKKAKVPAVGFVNERQLFQNEKRDEAQVDLLRSWLDAGLELGNHTYSHQSLNNTPLEDYKADVIRGEVVTKELLSKQGKTLRYFRYPFLHAGRSLEIKNKFQEFLRERNYTNAPVTFDNSDWIFARAYDNAFARGDKEMMKRVGAAYVPYLKSRIDYWERQSVKLFGREVKQIFLLHANSVNAEYFGDVVVMLKKRGYEFITLEEALKDNAYNSPDTFIGAGGISWLHRWAVTKGKEYVLPDEPYTPEFVMKEAGVTSE